MKYSNLTALLIVTYIRLRPNSTRLLRELPEIHAVEVDTLATIAIHLWQKAVLDLKKLRTIEAATRQVLSAELMFQA